MDNPFVRQLTPNLDSRGVSTRLFDVSDLMRLNFEQVYVLSVSNNKEGTIRGLHMQIEPYAEWKLVTVTEGSILDVVIDLRPNSIRYGTAYTCTMSASEPMSLSIPRGFAHGYQTLSSNTKVLYCIDQKLSASHRRVYSPNGDQISSLWPLPISCISEADRAGADLPFTELQFFKLTD